MHFFAIPFVKKKEADTTGLQANFWGGLNLLPWKEMLRGIPMPDSEPGSFSVSDPVWDLSAWINRSTGRQ
jgi:hypothetical protein